LTPGLAITGVGGYAELELQPSQHRHRGLWVGFRRNDDG
jgi:hypothetical protein